MQWGLLVEFSCNFPIRYLIALLRALLIVRSFVLEWRVVATTVSKMGDIKFSSLEWAGSKDEVSEAGSKDEVSEVFRQGKVALNVR